MSQISFLEAWSGWASGDDISRQVLWGISIHWWGRIGKVVQLIGGLTIVAEIVGAERIRGLGKPLRDAMSYQGIKRKIIAAFGMISAQIIFIFIFFRHRDDKKRDEAANRVHSPEFFKLNVITAMILAAVGAYDIVWKDSNSSWLESVSSWIALVAFSLMFVSPFVVSVAVITFSLLGFLVDALVVEPLAWLVEQPHLDKSTKIISVLFLLLGFHFDLLAS